MSISTWVTLFNWCSLAKQAFPPSCLTVISRLHSGSWKGDFCVCVCVSPWRTYWWLCPNLLLHTALTEKHCFPPQFRQGVEWRMGRGDLLIIHLLFVLLFIFFQSFFLCLDVHSFPESSGFEKQNVETYFFPFLFVFYILTVRQWVELTKCLKEDREKVTYEL